MSGPLALILIFAGLFGLLYSQIVQNKPNTGRIFLLIIVTGILFMVMASILKGKGAMM